MDGLRSIFNEGPRYFRQWYVSLVPFIDISKLTAAGIVQEDYPTDELLRRNFGSARFEYSDVWIDEKGFTTAIKTGAMLSCFSVDSSETSVCRRARNCLQPRPKLSISTCADSRLEKAFQLGIIAYLSTYSDQNSHNREDLWNTRSVAGSRLLQCLEKVLSNSSLSDCGADNLIALAKILCLTISVVIPSPPRVQSLPVSLL